MTSTDFSFIVESVSGSSTPRSSQGERTNEDVGLSGNNQTVQQTNKKNQHCENDTEEQQFILLLLKRDQPAWREFVTRYEKLIVSRVMSACREFGMMPQSALVEDCGAEVMATLFKGDMQGLRQFQGRSKLSTWLAVVARRATLDFLRRQHKEQVNTRPNDSRFDIATIPEVTANNPANIEKEIEKENRAQLQVCFNQLKKTDQQALTLHFDQQLSYVEIGQILGISENAVGPKLSRAQKRLRKLVEVRNKQS